MLLQSLPRPLPLHLLAHISEPDDEHNVSNHVYVLVLVIACCGGALHGVAMALRKKYGEGKEKYWLEWKWWIGFWADGLAGAMIWPAMPFVSVQIFAPLIIVIQLASSYISGLIIFREKCIFNRNVGLAFAVAGVIGVSLSTSHRAAHFTIGDFWAGFVTTRFLITTLVIVISLSGCFAFVHRSTFWALTAAALEGIQYICSRSIVDSIFEFEFHSEPAVLAAIILKGLCILGILHFQQLGLDADLSRFAGIYLVGCTLFMCIYGWAFFGDAMPVNIVFFGSAVSTLAGIFMLNQSEDSGGKKEEVKDDAAGNPQDA